MYVLKLSNPNIMSFYVRYAYRGGCHGIYCRLVFQRAAIPVIQSLTS